MSATRAGAETTNRASATLVGAAAARQKQLSSLSSSINSVRALAARQPAGAVPSKADIDAAVKAASTQLAEETASLRDLRATTADGVVRARDMVATASAIYAKVC